MFGEYLSESDRENSLEYPSSTHFPCELWALGTDHAEKKLLTQSYPELLKITQENIRSSRS